ncbi:hypothetical protein LB507_001461, partial [Fusarium sp. FIESC RH6]
LTPERLAEFDNIRSLPDTDAVLVFTAELDLRRQSQKGKSIASRLFPVLQAVHSFTGVLDTFVSSNPIIAALVWGSLKMTIQIVVNAASYYEAFAELLMSLGTVCPRFEQYQALFPTSTRLQVGLCNFNASIIRCCQRVIQLPKSSSGWISPLNPLSPSFWQSFQQSFEPNLKELRDYSKNVKEEIRLAQAQSEHRNRELQKLEKGEAERSRRSLNRFMSRTETRLDRLQLIRNKEIERERKQKLLDSLSSHDYMKPFKQARQKRYPQSASWIFDTNEFRSWADGELSPLLWCSGKMGSGKTILAIKGAVAFYFSRFDDSEPPRAENSLRALARQIINIHDISDDALVALGGIQNASGGVLEDVTYLIRLLLISKRQPAWIVIDGVDEWHRDERHKLVRALSTILKGAPDVKVFATSRDSPDPLIEKAFPSLHRVSMTCLEAQGGMAQLVDQAVQKSLDAEDLLVNDKSLIADIQKTLTEHADGMILWVTLVLRDLCMQPNNERIRDAISLRNLPKSLADVFNRALERIIYEGKEGITQAILPWIAAAKQPLSLSQLEECCFIRVLQEHTIKDRYLNSIHLVDSWFQGLIEVDPETQTIHFIHSSVQKFFLTAPGNSVFNGFYVNMEEADRHIGEVVVTYLNFNNFKKTLTKQRQTLPPISPEGIYQQSLSNELGWRSLLLRSRRARSASIDATIVACTKPFHVTPQERIVVEHPFLLYASNHWLSHSSTFKSKQCRVLHLWRSMLLNGHELAISPVSEGQHQAIDEAFIRWAMANGNPSLLYVMATSLDVLNDFHKAKFEYVVDENNLELLLLMVKTKAWGLELDLPCCNAARYGLVDILKVLVEAGVDLNGPIDFPSTRLLIEAIKAGKVKAIEFLIEKGADPNLPTRSYRNALEPAVEFGGSEGIQICQMLIEAGADPNGETRNLLVYNALQMACKTGQEEIVNLLLKAGANPNLFSFGTTPLVMSIEKEHFQIIKLLLTFGADVNGSGKKKWRIG